jgi:translation elongation factor EF-1alpha
MEEIPVVLIGHKDHGKSTLIGRLLLDTNSIKKRRFKEIQEVDRAWRRKFELAHLVDSFQEERENEMTMDTTRAILKGKTKNYQLIDVPGHSELIANMLSGASNAEAAILVVSSTEGIKEQTIQHLEIAHLLGIKQLGVVINKIDAIKYKKELFSELKERTKLILKKIGYSTKNLYFFPVSALNGTNVVKKSKYTKWYKGSTVMNFLEKNISSKKSLYSLPFCFLVQDYYSGEKSEIIMGRIESGKIKNKQKIIILPSKKEATIIKLKTFNGALVKAESGENIGIILKKKNNVKRGMVIASTNHKLKVDKNIFGKIFWIKKPYQKNLTLECGTNVVKGKINNKSSIYEGKILDYNIVLEKPIVFDSSSKTILGKMALKENGQIIGVGNIKC